MMQGRRHCRPLHGKARAMACGGNPRALPDLWAPKRNTSYTITSSYMLQGRLQYKPYFIWGFEHILVIGTPKSRGPCFLEGFPAFPFLSRIDLGKAFPRKVARIILKI